MSENVEAIHAIKNQLHLALTDLQSQPHFAKCKQLVVGCSTSEVIGKKIGTAGTIEVAEAIYDTVMQFCQEKQISVAFQCCEHLNRALIVEEAALERFGYEEVAVVPVRSAGGALATCAFEKLEKAVVVEHVRADAGIDIGDTFIGMHLKHVAVPVRSTVREIGQAHLTMAVTRPKLIGGMRAQYGTEER